jgi:Kdo2-lipid IVA lauroyltransferase/acyltransferase
VVDKFVYWLIRALVFPLGYLPVSWIHRLGKCVGLVCFYCMHTWRKRALSHIALAKDLGFSNEEIIAVAKQSFQNLAINCLEYAKLARAKNLASIIQCENPEVADQLHAEGKGIVFFCAHQANWEVLFLDGTQRMKGVAIGKPIKNKYLYAWILSIRQRFGGTIINPKNAVKEGFRALKKGVFVGIVGDQAMPDSSYSFPFFGRRAFNSTAPALLAYRANSPMIFAETRRVQGGYRIRYSDPIWPNLDEPIESEVVRMMNKALELLQESIRKRPGEWLWQHNRWKQQTPQVVYHRFRHDAVCVVLSEEHTDISVLREIYPLEFLTLLVPTSLSTTNLPPADEVVYYNHISETLRPDLRPKLILDFTSYEPLKKHYQKLSALEIVTFDELKQIAKTRGANETVSDVLKRALCRPGTLWREHAV